MQDVKKPTPNFFIEIGRLLVQSGWREAYLVASGVENKFQAIGPTELKKYVDDFTSNYNFEVSFQLVALEYQRSRPADLSIVRFNPEVPCTFYVKFDGAVLRVASRPIAEHQVRLVVDVVDALELELDITKRLEKFESTLKELKAIANFLAPGQKRTQPF